MILHKIANVARKIAEKIQPIPVSPQQLRVIPWFKANGDRTLRLDYDELSIESLVFDIGGYEGQWASDIYSKYRCKIFVFEPYVPYAENIKKRFRGNNDILVFEFGLANQSRDEILNISEDSSSIFKKTEHTTIIKLEEALSFFQKNRIEEVDLMKINIEGGEYDLIEHFLQVGLIQRIKNLQVQFHDFVPSANQRMKKIQEKLSETHEVTYTYEYVWENWKRKQ